MNEVDSGGCGERGSLEQDPEKNVVERDLKAQKIVYERKWKGGIDRRVGGIYNIRVKRRESERARDERETHRERFVTFSMSFPPCLDETVTVILYHRELQFHHTTQISL